MITLNLSQLKSETWKDFYDFVQNMWSDEERYGLHHQGVKGLYRIACWDTPYLLEFSHLYGDEEGIDAYRTYCILHRFDEVLDFQIKMAMFVKKGAKDRGSWCSYSNNDIEAFAILAKYTGDKGALLLRCEDGGFMEGCTQRPFREFRSFLKAMDEALVRMVVMPRFETFFSPWKRFFGAGTNRITVDEIASLMRINGIDFGPSS